jgi:hypothetical protein
MVACKRSDTLDFLTLNLNISITKNDKKLK